MQDWKERTLTTDDDLASMAHSLAAQYAADRIHLDVD